MIYMQTHNTVAMYLHIRQRTTNIHDKLVNVNVNTIIIYVHTNLWASTLKIIHTVSTFQLHICEYHDNSGF